MARNGLSAAAMLAAVPDKDWQEDGWSPKLPQEATSAEQGVALAADGKVCSRRGGRSARCAARLQQERIEQEIQSLELEMLEAQEGLKELSCHSNLSEVDFRRQALLPKFAAAVVAKS